MAVVVASTTSSQEELNHAASENWRTPPEEVVPAAPAPNPDDEIPEVEEDGKTPAVTEPAEKPEDGPSGRRGRYQRKIDKLVSRTTDLESELSEARRKIEELSARKTEQPIPQTSEPKQEQYKSVEEYVKALVKWERQQEEIRDEQAAQAEQRGLFVKDYNKRVVELQAETDDFDDVVSQDLQVPTGVIHAIVEMGSQGPDVAYYLGKHPEICEELCDMPWLSAVRRVGLIANELSGKTPPKDKPRTTPPPPVRAVTAGSTHASVPLDDPSISPGEYVRIRNQQVREKMGRRR